MSEELFYRVIGRYKRKVDASNAEARINMIGIAHAITADEAKSSASWYAIQKPAGGRSGNPALIEQGKELFLKGLPAQGMLACQTCHGAEAEGKAKAPRLAGQNGSYLLSEMAKFKAGDRQHAPEMTMIAAHVDSDQFRALAAYLQSR